MVCATFDRILITYLRNTHDDDSRDGGLALRQSCNSFFSMVVVSVITAGLVKNTDTMSLLETSVKVIT